MPTKVRLTSMIVRTGDVVHDLNQLHFSSVRWPEGWQPDMTAYRYDGRIEVWLDLAGVDKSDIHVDVLADRIRVSGERRSPVQARDRSGQCRQVLTMEIKCGHFCREILLPADVDRHGVTARHESGLLWIVLPLA